MKINLLPANENRSGRAEMSEAAAFAAVLLAMWLKFFALDASIARALDWPMFASMNFGAMRYALRAAAVGIPSLAVLTALVVPFSLLPRKTRGGGLLLIDFLVSALVLTDFLFMRYYTDIFLFSDIMLIGQTGAIARSIFLLLNPWDLLIFADIPLFWMFLKRNKPPVIFKKISAKRLGLSFLALLICLSVAGASVYRLVRARPAIINAMYDRLSVCAWTGAAGFHLMDAAMGVRRAVSGDATCPIAPREISEWFQSHYAENKNPAAAGKNLIVIQSEALQLFAAGLRVMGREVTPNLNKFISECLYFPNTWGQTAGGSSADAELMTNAGLFPAAVGAAYTRFASNYYESLPRRLAALGYKSVAVQGTDKGFWNCNRMYPSLCFDAQYSRNNFPDGEVIGLGLSDREIFSKSLEITSAMKKPFYAFIVTLSSHHPFDFEGLADEPFPLPEELKGTLVGDYISAINYYDRELGRFIEGLRKNGLLEKSLVVIYGDHPAIPVSNRGELEKLLGIDLRAPAEWKKSRKIPLLFRVPGTEKYRGVDCRDVGQIDVLPTISGLMGLKMKSVFGRDLLSDKSPEPVIFRNGSYIADGAFVEPSANRVTELATGRRLSRPARDFSAEVRRALSYSDAILEKDMMKEAASGVN